DVEEAAQRLAERARSLEEGQILVAGGEPTVTTRGNGRGGRCSELAIRFALAWQDDRLGVRATNGPRGKTSAEAMPTNAAGRAGLAALFGSSDGVDGNSGAAGILLTLPAAVDRAAAEEALRKSDSFSLASRVGEAIMIPPTGNNLRDLFLLART